MPSLWEASPASGCVPSHSISDILQSIERAVPLSTVGLLNMIEPISAACLATLGAVVNAISGVSIGSAVSVAVSGMVGNRADWMFCKLMHGTAENFLNNAPLPENHDLLLGLLDAHQRSIAYVAETISSQKRDVRDGVIADKVIAVARKKVHTEAGEFTRLMPLIAPLIAGPGEQETGKRREGMIAAACEGLIAWFEAQTGEVLPEHFRRLFAEPAPNGRAPWVDIFRLHLSNTIKTQPRFERIFLASNVAEIAGRVVTLEILVIELGKGLEALQAQLDLVAADVKQVLEIQSTQGQQIDRVAEQIERMLQLFSRSPLAAQAREAHVDARAFVLLARKINLEVDDENQALNELSRAVEELLKLKATAEHGTSIDALVNQALRRIAEQSLRGEFESAAKEAESAFAEWELREAERRQTQRQSGLILIEANIQQQLLRRDSVAVADWVERRLQLESDGKPVSTKSLMPEVEVWYERGRDRGLNLDLAVAIALSRRAVELATADDRGAALNYLGITLSILGERESGTERLEEAVAAYRAALEEHTRERVPLDWEQLQRNLKLAEDALKRKQGS